jgi:hypothetical protein
LCKTAWATCGDPCLKGQAYIDGSAESRIATPIERIIMNHAQFAIPTQAQVQPCGIGSQFDRLFEGGPSYSLAPGPTRLDVRRSVPHQAPATMVGLPTDDFPRLRHSTTYH